MKRCIFFPDWSHFCSFQVNVFVAFFYQLFNEKDEFTACEKHVRFTHGFIYFNNAQFSNIYDKLFLDVYIFISLIDRGESDLENMFNNQFNFVVGISIRKKRKPKKRGNWNVQIQAPTKCHRNVYLVRRNYKMLHPSIGGLWLSKMCETPFASFPFLCSISNGRRSCWCSLNSNFLLLLNDK